MPRAGTRALLGALRVSISFRFPHTPSTASRIPVACEKVALTLQPQKGHLQVRHPWSVYLARHRATSCHLVSALTHHILCCHCLCHASAAKGQLLFSEGYLVGCPIHFSVCFVSCLAGTGYKPGLDHHGHHNARHELPTNVHILCRVSFLALSFQRRKLPDSRFCSIIC